MADKVAVIEVTSREFAELVRKVNAVHTFVYGGENAVDQPIRPLLYMLPDIQNKLDVILEAQAIDRRWRIVVSVVAASALILSIVSSIGVAWIVTQIVPLL